MNSREWRATLGLGALYALRMVGIFMILPIFEIYANGLPVRPSGVLVGFALTVSGLTQALFQVPLGRLSDRIGRKPVIALGMVIFALGSLVAGLSDRIELIALGRALQGVGAVSSAVTALIADVTREEVRTTAMAIVGAGMGFAFVVALVLGPVAEGLLGGVPKIFLITAVLSILALPLIWWSAPGPERIDRAAAAGFGGVLGDRELLKLCAGALLLHAMAPCLFLGAPLLIRSDFSLPVEQHWKVYLPILLGTLVLALPLMRRADRGAAASLLRAGVATLALALLIAGLAPGRVGLIAGLVLFFLAFNLLEGLLPSLVSRRAPPAHKGAVLGVYATAQVLGQPLGGFLGGWTFEHAGPAAVLAVAACLPLLWLAIVTFRRSPDPA